MSRRYASILIIFASLLVSAAASAQTVVTRARLGNRIEDITFVSNGRFANHLAFTNGYEILVAPLRPQGGPKAQAPLTKLFDVRSAGFVGGARGLVYIPSEKLFAFHSATSGDLFLVDENGIFRGTRPLIFTGAAATYSEGMDYLPRSSPFFPDHLILIANWFADGSQQPRIEVMRRDGTVVAEIVPQSFGSLFDPADSLLGLAYLAPDKLLVTVNDGTNNIWMLDFTGKVVGTGPVWEASGWTNFEGIVQVADGRVAATEYVTGLTRFFDRKMNRLPDQDRAYSVGIGVGLLRGIAWNSDTDEYLVSSLDPEAMIRSVTPSLDSSAPALISPQQNGNLRLTYDSSQSLVAAWNRHATPVGAHNFMTFFDSSTGAFAYEQDLSSLGGATARGLEYLPATDRFAVAIGATFQIATRTGPPTQTIDISGTGLVNPLGIAYDPLHPSGSRLLLCDNANMVVFDLDGNVLPGGFNLREKLNMTAPADISAITTGPQAGAFAILDGENSELIVFTLP